MFGSFTRHYKEKGINLKTDIAFRQTRDTLEARRKQLKTLGLGNKKNKSQPFTPLEIEHLWESGELGSGGCKCI